MNKPYPGSGLEQQGQQILGKVGNGRQQGCGLHGLYLKYIEIEKRNSSIGNEKANKKDTTRVTKRSFKCTHSLRICYMLQ